MSHPTGIPTELGVGDVVVASLSQARKHKRRFEAVITLEDPACRPSLKLRFYRKPAPAHLVLAFEDVDVDTIGVRVATRVQVEQALAFAREHVASTLLVHCFHGIGRSAAMALAIMADRMGPGNEQLALERLLTIRPEATPNLVVVKLADEILARRGRLVSTVAAWEATTIRVQDARKARLENVRANPQAYSWL
jgi:predicted protein tyrosine phosphatase